MDSLKVVKKNWDQLSRNDSNDPSYSCLELPYRVICRQRYAKAGTQQRRQFVKELKRIEMLQFRALDGVRIHREFINYVLSPPSPNEIITLTAKEQFKLEELLKM